MKLSSSRLAWSSLLAVSAAAALAGSALLSCNLADPFAAYTGVNFIAGDDFNTSGWTLVDQSLTALSSSSPSPYLTYTSVSATSIDTQAGLPSGGSDIHLLEIPNLMPNGDFESTTVGLSPAGWTANGGATDSVIAGSTTGAIDGNTLSYSIPASGSLSYDLSASGGLADGFPANAQYRILFTADSSNGSAAYFDYDNGTATLLSSPWTVTFGSTSPYISHFPQSGTNSEIASPASGSGYFTIGSVTGAASAQAGGIDNLRVTRVDIEPYLHLTVPYGSPSASRPAFISGTYEFSVYARLEDATNVTPTVANAFDADGITLGINGARAEVPASSLSRTQWTKVSVKTVIQVSASPLPTDTLADLYVTPTEVDNRDVGGLLINSPSLTFLPNG